VRNNQEIQPASFMIRFEEDVKTTSWITVFFSAVTGIIFTLLVCVCISRSYRDCSGGGIGGANINWDLEMADANWDED